MIQLLTLESVARMAGNYIKDGFRMLHRGEHDLSAERKNDGTLVTIIDREINDALGRFARVYDLGFVGEEGNGAINHEDILLVDPLDGTTAFTRGMNTATIILTLMRRFSESYLPVLAVIYEPLTERMWSADFATQAPVNFQFANETPRAIRIPQPPRHDKIRSNVCVWPGAGYQLDLIQRDILADHRFDDQQMGAVGISAGLIASGMLDLCMFGPTSAVEAAAMTLIVTCAGGVAYDFKGQPLLGSGFTFGEVRGKPDFMLPHGALFARNSETALIAFEHVWKHNPDACT
jgi:histidinol-phosphatase